MGDVRFIGRMGAWAFALGIGAGTGRHTLGGVCPTLRFGFVLVIAVRDARGDQHRKGLVGVRTVGQVEIDRNVRRFADQTGDINTACDAFSRAECGAGHGPGP